MSSAILAEMSDAVAAALNAAVAAVAFGAGVNFTAVRSMLPDKDLKDYATLTVLVCIKGFLKHLESRRDVVWEIAVDVTTAQQVADKTNATLDPLVKLVTVMASKAVLETMLPMSTGGAAEWIATSSNPHFDRNRLATQNLFFNKTTYTYVTTQRR